MDRQVYYRRIKRKSLRRCLSEQVVAMVNKIRLTMPRLGGKKLYYLLYKDLRTLKIGRDKFFAILKANYLLIIPKRNYHVTTDSYHRFKKHKNLIENMNITRPEQVWVSDITYIGKRSKPCYLSLITDAYSKQIMGYNVAPSLNAESSLKALKMALKKRKDKDLGLIHHYDRGIQYCCDEYQTVINKTKKLFCSMTESYDPYQNAVAERVNGILKQEFMVDRYKDYDINIIKSVVKESINIYNTLRPHWSNYMLTPVQMHQQAQIEMRTYKTKNRSNPKATSV
ncbi:IS3 family transposase [Flavobacterium sp. MFBS3-15]|uniref:IS3 family transposase n=1 Tax=Flavobacterium sp. MFBS3-15 TaxID=2989816 RepID=UPI0022356060|nr:IS3 family transposase [Flavobacterium sp. MFBS3-15]MCW4467609.1 IS3 family transposase [Flavobacterium sp. MFBS3-15]